jgi:hypothetical protein
MTFESIGPKDKIMSVEAGVRFQPVLVPEGPVTGK